MAIKQRYQNPALGDDLRLQSFVFNNGMNAFIKTIAKVEIFRKNAGMSSMSNPEGLSLVKTIVSHLGQPTTEIFAHPSSDHPEYWETMLHIDEDSYELTEYVDRWHYILDENADFYAPAAEAPYRDSSSIRGTVPLEHVVCHYDGSTQFVDVNGDPIAAGDIAGMQVTVFGTMDGSLNIRNITKVQLYNSITTTPGDHTGTANTVSTGSNTFTLQEFNRRYYQIELPKNRQIRTNGITDGNGRFDDFSFTDAVALISSPKAVQSTESNPIDVANPSFGLPIGFLSDPFSIAGYILVNLSGTTSNPTGGSNQCYFKMSSSDGINWTGNIEVDPNNPFAYEPVSITGLFSPDDMVFNVTVDWDNIGPVRSALVAHFVTEWRIAGVEYKPTEPNAWDDLIERTPKSKKMFADHSFTIWPEQWFTSSRPLQVGYNFDSEPAVYYLNTRNWMSVRVRPSIPLNPETQRYHFTLLASGVMRYEIYKSHDGTAVDASRWRKILDGVVYWHEENTGLLRIDTMSSPLNRPAECFIVFYVDLPDGSTIRSGRLFFTIEDDLQISSETAEGAIF